MHIKNNEYIIAQESMNQYEILSTGEFSISFFIRSLTENNPCEDCLAIAMNQGMILVAVADGVGSSEKSYRASYSVLDNLCQYFCSASPSAINQEELENQLFNFNQKLLSLSGPPQTTLTATIIATNKLLSIQCGDSTAMVIGGRGKIKFRSNIHSELGEQFGDNQISELSMVQDPNAHYVDNIMGINDSFFEFDSYHRLAQQDTIILASDGIFDNILSTELQKLLRTGTIAQHSTTLTQACLDFKTPLTKTDFRKPDDVCFILMKKT